MQSPSDPTITVALPPPFSHAHLIFAFLKIRGTCFSGTDLAVSQHMVPTTGVRGAGGRTARDTILPISETVG